MSTFHEDYAEARAAAQELADRLGRASGIERCKEFGRPGYRVRSLPRPENRQGYELRVEVVEPQGAS